MKLLIILLTCCYGLSTYANEKISEYKLLTGEEKQSFIEGLKYEFIYNKKNFTTITPAENMSYTVSDKQNQCLLTKIEPNLIMFKTLFFNKSNNSVGPSRSPMHDYELYEVDSRTVLIISKYVINKNADFKGQQTSFNLYINLSEDQRSIESMEFEFHKQKMQNDGTIQSPILRPEFIKDVRKSDHCK